MRKAVIEDRDQSIAFLAAHPLCIWSAQKQEEILKGRHLDQGRSSVRPPAPKDDNADLLAALSSMA